MANTRTRKINQNVELNTTYDFVANDGTFSGTVTGNSFIGPLEGNVTGTVSSLSNHDTGDLDEGTNLYFTTARARAAFSPGTGVNITSGVISIGQSVSTASDVTFGSVTATTFEGALTGDVIGNADTASALEAAVNIALTGSVTGNVDFDGSGNVSITTTTNHNHDDRYYTETESDGKYLLNTTDTLDGDLTITGDLNVTGTIDLSNADLNIGAADIVFGTVTGGATRGLIWDVSGSYLSKLIGGGADGGKVTLFANMDDAITTGNIFEIKDGSLGSLFLGLSHAGILTAGGGTSTQWNTAYGWGNHADGGYQAASTAITTSNIGSQSVNYANTAGSTSYLSALGDYVWNASTNGRDFNRGIQTSFVSASESYPSFGSVVRVRTYTGSEDGGTAELYFPYNSTYGGSSMRYRLGQYSNAGWTSWKTVIDSDNIGGQSVAYAANAGLLDSIDSTSFLRSDVNDTASGKVFFTHHTTTDPLAAVEINGGGTHTGLYINPAASSQAHVRFGTNGTLKWQIRAPFQDGVNADLKIYSWVSGDDMFNFKHNGILNFKIASGTIISTGGGSDAFGYNTTYGHYIQGTGSTYIYGNGVYYDGAVHRTLIHSGNIAAQSVASAGNADTLDSLDSSQFLRSDTDDTMAGNLQIGSSSNKYIRFYTATNWYYYLGAINNDFYIYDAQGLNFFSAFYNGGGTNKYAAILDKLYVYNNGRVGIGTTNPQAPLHVIAANTNDNDLIQEWSYSTSTQDVYSLMLKQTVTPNVVRYNFSMVNNGTAYDDVLVLDRGNVGIGTTSPDVKLTVEDNNINSVQFKLKNNNISNGNKYLAALVGGTSGFSVPGWANSGVIESAGGTGSNFVLSNYENGPIIFQTNTRNEKVRITGDGKLGIGTTLPSGKLHIVGTSQDTLIVDSPSYPEITFRQNGAVKSYDAIATSDTGYFPTSLVGDRIYRTEAGNHIFGYAGVEIMRLRTNLNVKIGRGTPPAELTGLNVAMNGDSYILASNNSISTFMGADTSGYGIIGTLTNHALGIRTNNSVRVYITQGGSVGIGTTSPATKLDVQISNAGTGLGDGMILKLKNTSTINNTRSGIVFGNIDSIGGALAMQSAILKNSATGEFDMTWDLYGGAAGWKEALLYLDSNPGNVGVGTTSPASKLDVAGQIRSTAATGEIYAYSTNSSNLATIYAGWTTGTGMMMRYLPNTAEGYIENNYPVTSGTVYGDINFRQNVGGTMTTRMIIKADGAKVGIGTISPVAKLHIVNESGIGRPVLELQQSNSGSNILQWKGSSGSFLGIISDAGDVGIGTTSPNFYGTAFTRQFTISNSTSSQYANLTIAGGSGASGGMDFGNQTIRHAGVYGLDGSNLGLYTNASNSGGGLAEWMRITSGGYVGIRTSNPQAPLHVIAAGAQNNDLIQEWSYTNGTQDLYSLMLKQTVTSGVVRYNFSMVNAGTGYNDVLVLDRGSVGIGTTDPAYKLDVNGTIRATGDVYAYSDARVKENVETIDNALNKVMAMRGVSYNRTDNDDKTKKIGVIAQEIQKVLPEVVSEQEDGMLSVSYGNIVGVLIEAIKEQQKQIDELKALLNVSTK